MNNKEFIDYISEQFRQGLNRSQIAKKLGMTLEEFENKCNAIYGITTKKPEAPKKHKEEKRSSYSEPETEIHQLKNAGYSNTTIAEELNIPESPVKPRNEE